MSDYLQKLVKKLREGIDNLPDINSDVLTVCIESCFLSSQKRSPFLEKYIKNKFKIKPPKNSTSGDGVSKKGYNVEIKVSLGGGAYNFVQIRPDHDIDFYLFLCYDYNIGKTGEISWFLIPEKKMTELILFTKCYAHGTIAKLGKICRKNIKGHNNEYAIRISSKTKGKSKEVWKKLQEFSTTEEKIKKII